MTDQNDRTLRSVDPPSRRTGLGDAGPPSGLDDPPSSRSGLGDADPPRGPAGAPSGRSRERDAGRRSGPAGPPSGPDDPPSRSAGQRSGLADPPSRPADPSSGSADAAWQVQEAKARFSELLEASLAEGPQIITRRGLEIAAVVPIDQWRRLESTAPSLKDWLLEPDADAEVLTLPRRKLHLRPVQDFD